MRQHEQQRLSMVSIKMGLGKTLQSIAVLWVMLKQGMVKGTLLGSSRSVLT